MIDWLQRAPDELPKVAVGERLIPVVLRRLPQARRITMRLSPDGSEVRVSLPRWGTSREALHFVRSKADWLETQLAKVPETCEPRLGDTLPWCGRELVIRHDPLAPRRPAVEGQFLVVGGPHENMVARLRRWLEGEARRIMAEDLAYYCTRAAQAVPRLALSSAQRRWGSCSTRGAIRLNWRLVMAPEEVRRSVVAHEVAHLVHFDHSPAFHAMLGRLFEGDLKAANRWLKREGRGLYARFG